MILGMLLNTGESLTNLKTSGQDERLIDYYLKNYTKEFKKVYLFSYAKENYKLPKKCILIYNQLQLHRFIYAFLMPILCLKEFKQCDVFRVTHLLGSLPAIIAKIFLGKKYLVTFGYDYKKFAQVEGKGCLFPLICLIEFLNFLFADGIIVANKKIQSYVKASVSEDRVFYIPNGVDIRLFKPNSAISNQQSAISKTILFVGRLERQKNLFTLIKAVSLLENKRNILLKFVGEGSLHEQLGKYAQDLKVNLQIIRPVPYDKMPLVYQQADIFVLPSLVEGHPKVLLEAMACGLVCVGNNIESINTVIRNNQNGLVFHNVAKNLSWVLRKVLDKPRMESRLGFNGREFVVKNFNFDKLIKKEIKILKRL